MSQKSKILDEVIAGLMNRYTERVRNVQILIREMIRENLISKAEEIENDHIAFRTLGLPHLGIASLEKIFLHLGYTKMDKLHFAEKKLDAFWYSPPYAKYPRVFISELRVKDLSPTVQDIIHSYTKDIVTDPVDDIDLNEASQIDSFLHSALWKLPDLAHYKILAEESEYAAWVIYNRYYLNHFTISVHNLPEGYNDIYLFSEWVEGLGIKLNMAGGKIKISKDGLLLQSSTVAEMLEAIFKDGERIAVPGSYIEFAERKLYPQYSTMKETRAGRAYRRDGFETGNADKIFESTYTNQTSGNGHK